MTDRLLGELPNFFDMGEARTLGELVLAHLGPTAGAYDVAAVERDYLVTVNKRLEDTGLSVDENGDVHADGFVDDDIRELLDDAFFRADLTRIAAAHKL
ncbi:hypothetical protein SK803_42545 [Lentzea sp. BCCO 10_0856]|uniref:Uncharacterized protein n=1 Tax=Lentzea miocenica TaxID=3095431 RepID=A0ABU4TFD7_9PSEU|nr:hypothetical protein [Lentzea sp. BCCO 10_0856]MDX8036917.1 hypothetical protein [Lentzea sp. BCCO 10_0856]